MSEKSRDTENDVTQWELVEIILGVKPEQRKRHMIEQILPWFRERSAFFRMLEEESLIGMIRYATLSWHLPDSVVIRQGEIGDCFYVIVRGTLSVYARPTKRKSKIEVVAKDLAFARGIQERLRFGNELAQLTSGRCFGELSVLKKDGERNASVIADEPTLLICLKRATFLRFVHEKFANELLRKSGFVQTCPLFKKWPSAYKNLLTECLQIRNVEYGEKIIEQGSGVSSLFFVIKGQAKLSVNTDMHLRQYKACISQNFYRRLFSHYITEVDEDDDIYKFPVLVRRRRRQKKGFFATEVRQAHHIDLCVVISENGLIGDVEAVFDLPTYSATYQCLEPVTLYELDIPSFIRLIVKKNPETFNTMLNITASKMRFRHASIKEGVPLYAALLESRGPRRNELLGPPKFLPRLLVLQEKKRAQGRRVIKASKQGDSGQTGQRLKKVKMNINPAAGEIKMRNAPVDTRNSAIEWKENRDKRSLHRRENTRGNTFPNIGKTRTNMEGYEERQQLRKDEDSVRSKSEAKSYAITPLRRAAISAAKFQGLKKDQAVLEVSLDHYKKLRKRMMSMNIEANRVSWSG